MKFNAVEHDATIMVFVISKNTFEKAIKVYKINKWSSDSQLAISAVDSEYQVYVTPGAQTQGSYSFNTYLQPEDRPVVDRSFMAIDCF